MYGPWCLECLNLSLPCVARAPLPDLESSLPGCVPQDIIGWLFFAGYTCSGLNRWPALHTEAKQERSNRPAMILHVFSPRQRTRKPVLDLDLALTLDIELLRTTINPQNPWFPGPQHGRLQVRLSGGQLRG